MTWYNAIFGSVEDVWIVWLASCLLLYFLTRRLLRRFRRRNVLRFLREERGAAYSLGLVLVVPFYTGLIATVVETTLMLVVKTGTNYAAYAAARAAAVWLPDEDSPPPDAPDYLPLENREGMVHLAAVNAIWPYASGSREHVAGGPGAFPYNAQAARACIRAYHRYSGGRAPDDYLDRKWRYAAKATKIQIERSSAEFNAELTVTVEYEMPLNVPGVGRFLGGRASWGGARYFTRKISSNARIEKEGPKSENQSLGIAYYDAHGLNGDGGLASSDDTDKPPLKRYKGTLIFGSLGIPTGTPVGGSVLGGHIWLRDFSTGRFYKYTVAGAGVGASTHVGAAFMQAPVYVTARDPRDLEGEFAGDGVSATLGGGLGTPIEFDLPDGGKFKTGVLGTLGVGADWSFTGMKFQLVKVYDSAADVLRDTAPGQILDWILGNDE